MNVIVRRNIRLKEEKFKKIDFKKFGQSFIIICPRCGYSYRPGRDPKHKRNRKYRCPMCGYEWYHYDGIGNQSRFPT
jgi:transposase-like protein